MYKLLCLGLMSCVSVIGAATTAPEMAEQKTTAPVLSLRDDDNQRLGDALIMNTDVTGQVTGLIATVTITQTFVNPTKHWVHGRYSFPMPTNAAVDDLEFLVDGRVIKAELKPREAAKKAFVQAKKAGKKAALLEQQRPNLFSMDVANIPPNGTVQARIRFIDTVRFVDGQFELTLPTTLTPRYISGHVNRENRARHSDDVRSEMTSSTPKEQHLNWQNGWAKATNSVPDAPAITPPQTRRVAPNSHQFSLSLGLDAGIPITRIRSASHAIAQTVQAGIDTVTFSNAHMDKDFTLTWQPNQADMPSGGELSTASRR